MLKICKVCHKYFQGEEDVCPKCSQKIEDIRRKEEKKQGITSRIKQLSKSKIIIFIASTFILMTIFSQLTAKSKYNDEAKEIYLFAKKHTYFSDGTIDTDGNIYYGSNVEAYIDEENKQSKIDRANKTIEIIKKEFPKYKWIVNFNEGYAYCSKNNSSKKIGFYQINEDKPQYSSINDCIEALNSQQEEALEKYESNKTIIDQLSQTAIQIKRIIIDKYKADGIECDSFCNNIDNNNLNDEINKELSEQFSGYWIIKLGNYIKLRYGGGIEDDCIVYYAEDLENECVGSSLKNDSLTTEGGILSLLSDEADNECKFITIDEWDAKYSSKVDSLVKERINDELDELRKKTFNGNRSLDNISWFDLVDDDIYKEADQTNLQIQSCSVKIEDGEIVIDLSVKSNIEFKKNWIVEIGYYNAAGDRKGGCACNMGAIPGLGSDEGEFRGVPNCIDYLKYYRIEHIYS